MTLLSDTLNHTGSGMKGSLLWGKRGDPEIWKSQ